MTLLVPAESVYDMKLSNEQQPRHMIGVFLWITDLLIFIVDVHEMPI